MENSLSLISPVPSINFSHIGFLASHGDGSMEAIGKACREGLLKATPAVVISNNSSSEALKKANPEGIPALHISHTTEVSVDKEDLAILNTLRTHCVDLVVLCGYMRSVGKATLHEYEGRVLNIHPSLLPKFGGKGMYGVNVHKAVLKANEKETGISIHVVTTDYDTGPVIDQRRIPVLPDDTPETLSERVKALEPAFFVESLIKMQSRESL